MEGRPEGPTEETAVTAWENIDVQTLAAGHAAASDPAAAPPRKRNSGVLTDPARHLKRAQVNEFV